LLNQIEKFIIILNANKFNNYLLKSKAKFNIILVKILRVFELGVWVDFGERFYI